MEKEHVYEQTYQDYLSRIAEIDLAFTADKLDLQMSGDEVLISLFNRSYRLSKKDVKDADGHQPHLSISVILC